MKKILLLMWFILLHGMYSFAQEAISGRLVDVGTKQPLANASVYVKGGIAGTTTGLDGTFKIKVNGNGPKTLVFSFIGYVTAEKELSAGQPLIEIGLEPSATAMNEVVITSNNIAIDRKTPVAMSSVGAQFIQEKGGTQEFPELLKLTPGIQATRQGGGYGDSRVSIRGFKMSNIAVMVNGVPINDMENGSVYWSNWSGLTDVTTSMQVQRGLGASKIAVPSLGGTVNVQTLSTDAEKGGSISQGLGSNGYSKTAIYLSTGLDEHGWAFSLEGSRVKGDGNAEGLQFEGYNYFFNLSKKINDKHTLSLTGMGAPQWHGQRYNKQTISMYQNAPQGIQWNSDWGVKDGDVVNVRKNYYHKPIFSLNHYWTIDETSSLSTAAYFSLGTGGGTNFSGATLPRTGDAYSPYDLDAVVDANRNSVDGSAVSYLRSSVNNHRWYGVLSTYKKKLGDYIDLMGGADLRYYKGMHYTEVTDLLGADYALDKYSVTATQANGDINNPLKRAKVGDKVAYDYDSNVGWEGLFFQGEYSKDKLSTFISLAGSNSQYRRIDRFNYTPDDPMRISAWQNFWSYQAKGGLNYNLDGNNNIFANIGYISKPPILTNIFLNYRNQANPDAVNEKLLSYELGYGFRSAILSANINLYRSFYKDRAYQRSQTINEITYIANLTGVDELHEGIEVDFKFRPVRFITLSGSASLGNWKYTDDVGPISVFTDTQEPVAQIDKMFLKNVKLGDQAQKTVALGLDVDILPQVRVGANYNYYSNYWADFNFYSLTGEGLQPWKMPAYSLLDMNLVYRFKIDKLNASLVFNVYNMLNTEYVSDAYDATGAGTAAGSTVFYGIGRTFSTGLRVNF